MAKTKVKIPEVKIAQKKEETQELAPINDAEVYQMMDKRDEEQIVASLQGKYLDEFVYSFQQGGKMIEGLSWLGIQEAARAYGGIQCSIDKMKIEDKKDDIVVYVEAFDNQTQSSSIGVGVQAKMMLTYKGIIEDPFAIQKAVSKAQRNAKKQLLPQQLLKQWIEKHRKAKSNGDNGSLKVLIDEFHKTWQAKKLTPEYVQQEMAKKYGVKTTAQLNRDQLIEFTKWINDHQPIPVEV
jgi:hypothetical protein